MLRYPSTLDSDVGNHCSLNELFSFPLMVSTENLESLLHVFCSRKHDL